MKKSIIFYLVIILYSCKENSNKHFYYFKEFPNLIFDTKKIKEKGINSCHEYQKNKDSWSERHLENLYIFNENGQVKYEIHYNYENGLLSTYYSEKNEWYKYTKILNLDTTEYQYNNKGNVIKLSLMGFIKSYKYDSNDKLINQQIISKKDGVRLISINYTYTEDSSNSITQTAISENISSNITKQDTGFIIKYKWIDSNLTSTFKHNKNKWSGRDTIFFNKKLSHIKGIIEINNLNDANSNNSTELIYNEDFLLTDKKNKNIWSKYTFE
jgi:hypothetical protein